MKKILKKIYNNFRLYKLRYIIWEMLSFLFQIFPLENKVMVVNYYGKGYGDNAKYIVEKLLSKKIKIIWAVKNKDIQLPNGIKKVRINSIKYFYEIATSKIWIDNCRKPYYIKKRLNQYYIQTWHGAPALKKIERDAQHGLTKYYIESAQQDSKKIDVIISNSKWMTNLYKNSFWYKGDILEVGSPRNDIFYDKTLKLRDKIDKEYNTKDKIIILYAPTFRKNYSLEKYNLNYHSLKKSFEEKYKKEVIFFIRLHPNISNKSKNIKKEDYLFDVSSYDDTQELLYVSDILITDFSSLMFDFSLQNKPCFLYAEDLIEYKNDRDLYFDISELPFSFSQNVKEFKEQIYDFDLEKYLNNLNKFNLKIGNSEVGNASSVIYDLILKKL